MIVFKHQANLRRNKGFTLVELLVVIAIIGLLAGILFPVIGRARDNAKRSSCLSNLRQMGLATLQYVQDYDGRYPWNYWYYVDPDGVSRAHNWPTLIHPYVRNNQVFACPSAAGNARFIDPNDENSIFNRSSYGMNISAFPNSVAGTLQSTILKPAGLVFACDTAKTTGNPASQASFSSNLTDRHLEGANFNFADGHAKWFKYDVLTSTEGTPYESRVYKYWIISVNASS